MGWDFFVLKKKEYPLLATKKIRDIHVRKFKFLLIGNQSSLRSFLISSSVLVSLSLQSFTKVLARFNCSES